jgi:CRISPR-associated protein Csh2
LTNREILFYYESRQNPNGDPGFENQPRLMPDDRIIVTDVRLKRTIRDYARDLKDQTIFVDFDKNGNAVTADDRAKEIIGELKGKDVILELIKKTFDVPLFGALVTVRSNNSGEGDSHKLTGPVQFGIARSVNKVRIINPSITGRFVGAIKKKKEEGDGEQKQHSTIGKFYSVEYALIKASGAVTPRNLGKYINEKYPDHAKVKDAFDKAEGMLFECLWNGTNSLVTRSKYPQRSIFFLEVSYKSHLYNDLPSLVDERKEMRDWATSLLPSPFIFDRLIDTLESRKEAIEKIKIAYCSDIKEDAIKLADTLSSKGLKVESVAC